MNHNKLNNTTQVASKGLYIYVNSVDILFDDSWRYGQYMGDTTFILVPKKNFIMPNGGY